MGSSFRRWEAVLLIDLTEATLAVLIGESAPFVFPFDFAEDGVAGSTLRSASFRLLLGLRVIGRGFAGPVAVSFILRFVVAESEGTRCLVFVGSRGAIVVVSDGRQ